MQKEEVVSTLMARMVAYLDRLMTPHKGVVNVKII